MMKSFVEIGIEGKCIPEIKYLKGFSIFTIVLMHLVQTMTAMPAPIVTLSGIGGTGVHVFFLCSGIGLYLSYCNHKTSFHGFMKRRFLKIYIPYIIVVFISYLLPWMYERADRGTALLSHVFLFKMFVPRYEESFGTQFWFISTMFQLYFLFIPMCSLKEKIKSRKLFAALFLFVSAIWWIICYLFGVSSERVWSSFCLQYIWEFALGFIFADIFYSGKRVRIRNYILMITAFLGIGLQAMMVMTSESLKLFNDIPALIGYGSLALLLMNLPAIKWCSNRLSVFSYELFLVHIMTFSTVFHFLHPKGLVLQCFAGIISLGGAMVIAYIYNKFTKHEIHKKI